MAHATLRFSAEVLPRLVTSSYSTSWPSLSVRRPARSTAEMCRNTFLVTARRLDEPVALRRIKPLDGAFLHRLSPNSFQMPATTRPQPLHIACRIAIRATCQILGGSLKRVCLLDSTSRMPKSVAYRTSRRNTAQGWLLRFDSARFDFVQTPPQSARGDDERDAGPGRGKFDLLGECRAEPCRQIAGQRRIARHRFAGNPPE